jgi:hypothetical protein
MHPAPLGVAGREESLENLEKWMFSQDATHNSSQK